ncbi:MAG: glycoside hydrolase family 43 protein [Bacteroides sp.]|nr:glycoside hydrolase family 43 protein [Bacteroides sp.]MBD5376026.1 glycoside hydrolase family 43 protein [Bacteroides sp.]
MWDESDPEWIEGVPAHTDGGYLFAFITSSEYYRLHYAVSRDAYNWQTLNNGKIINETYKGHPDICQGPDGVYRMIGVMPLALWESLDLIDWTITPLDTDIFDQSSKLGYFAVPDYGAPKIFYDAISEQYIITWHACRTPNNNDWASMKTLYILTSDFKHFTEAAFLHNFSGKDADICTIDNIIRYIDGCYYSILKDEREPIFAPDTGKTIRISKSQNLTGPYNELSAPITPVGDLLEAPILIELPEQSGYALYAESFAGPRFGYHMFVADNIEGHFIEHQFCPPNTRDGSNRPLARHGCIVRIHEDTYMGLIRKYQ